MKHLIHFSFLIALIFTSCKKEISQIEPVNSDYLKNAKASIKDSMSTSGFAELDFSKAIISVVRKENVFLLRVPILGKNPNNDFLVIQTNSEGKYLTGRIINLEGFILQNKTFNGSVKIRSINNEVLIESPIEEGYVKLFHPILYQSREQTYSQPLQPYVVELPEIILVSSYTAGGGISYGTYLSLMSFVSNGSGGNTSSGYYTPSNPYGGVGGGSSGSYNGGGSSGGGAQYVEPIELEEEYIYNLPGVDLTKMFKCFDNVSSNGATYKIRLCSDIPSNSNPNASANFSAASGGHSFITITKANGSSSVTQSFGFYPREKPSFYDPFAQYPSEIRDNGFQEINASIEMNITENQFTLIKLNAIAWAYKNYDLAQYNCTNYALDIFNSVRTTPIAIPSYKIVMPGNIAPGAASNANIITISKSPQMLFNKLQQTKNANNTEAPNILIDQSHGYVAPISNGECN